MIAKTIKNLRARARLPYEILKCRITKTYKPLVILLYLTDRCNLSCKYCVGNWSHRKIKDYTTQEIKNIIDECKKLGAVHFTIHGGEIFLRNDTKEIVDYLKDNGFYVNVVTNGLLLPKKIDEIENIDTLCISLDGTEEVNDYNRGKGAYKAAMEAIYLAKERGFKFVVHGTLTKQSINDIEFLCEQAKEMGYIQQFSLLLKPITEDVHNLGLTDEEARSTLSKLIRLKKEGYPIFASYQNLNNALKWPFSFDKARLSRDEIPKKNNLIKCFYGKLKVAIDADGFVYPCSSLNDSFKALNVRDVGVKGAYEHIRNTNDCEACYYLTQNDWSLLLGGSARQFTNQLALQFKEVFKRV